MNNLDFINDALTLINVLPEGQNASPEQGATAMRFANELVDEWADDGLDLNWTPMTALTDENTLAGSELTALKYALAINLCPIFGREPPPALVAIAGKSYTTLLRLQIARTLEPVELALPRSEGGQGGYDILTGS